MIKDNDLYAGNLIKVNQLSNVCEHSQSGWCKGIGTNIIDGNFMKLIKLEFRCSGSNCQVWRVSSKDSYMISICERAMERVEWVDERLFEI